MRFLLAIWFYPQVFRAIVDPRVPSLHNYEGTLGDYVARESFAFADAFLKRSKEAK